MQIRLYVTQPLSEGAEVFLSETQAHYLRSVLREKTGSEVFLFNGNDGEFSGKITVLDKKKAVAGNLTRTKLQPPRGDLRLYFAPLKRDCTDMVVEKATELGATLICPVITEYTTASRVNTDRLKSIAIEACEQCRRLDMPEISEPVSLKELLNEQGEEKPVLIHLDESGAGMPPSKVIDPSRSAAFLVGPEGGFSVAERRLISETKNTVSLDLGERILRAETAALAVLALYSCFK